MSSSANSLSIPTIFSRTPDYSHDANGKAKLDELQKMIGDKQISVEDLNSNSPL